MSLLITSVVIVDSWRDMDPEALIKSIAFTVSTVGANSLKALESVTSSRHSLAFFACCVFRTSELSFEQTQQQPYTTITKNYGYEDK